jgi:hypothetical protein
LQNLRVILVHQLGTCDSNNFFSVKQHKQVFARTGEKYLEDGALDPVKVIGIQEHPDKALEFGLLFLAEKIGTPICLNEYKQIKDLDIKVGFFYETDFI